jgi:hypothetical protein
LAFISAQFVWYPTSIHNNITTLIRHICHRCVVACGRRRRRRRRRE